jgi:hypothetical protein
MDKELVIGIAGISIYVSVWYLLSRSVSRSSARFYVRYNKIKDAAVKATSMSELESIWPDVVKLEQDCDPSQHHSVVALAKYIKGKYDGLELNSKPNEES